MIAYHRFHLYEVSRIGKSVEITGCQGLWRRGHGEWLSMGTKFLFEVMEKFWN